LKKTLILLVGLLFYLSGKAFSSWPEFWLSSDCFLGNAQGTQTTASFAFDGTNFLVAWEDERINTQGDIFGARVSLEGEILDPIGIPIPTSQVYHSYVDVAWGGENYLVVWQEWSDGGWSVYGARVDPEGNVLDPDGLFIAGGSEWASCPKVASDGANFFVVWSQDNPETFADIYGTRITASGEVLDPEGISICATYLPEYYPSIAYNGSTYLVVWEHNQW
jgi:hypothetical protein